MVLNLSPGSAAVIIPAMAIVWGVVMKIFPRKETPQVIESFMVSIKEIMEGQTLLLEKMNETLILMKDKTNGSHEKLNIIMPSVLRIHDIENSVNDLRLEVAKRD